MNDYISRQAAINITAETGALETQRRIMELPPVTNATTTGIQPVVREAGSEVETAEWINADTNEPSKLWLCSNCKGLVKVGYYCFSCYYSFCPCCGKPMRGTPNDGALVQEAESSVLRKTTKDLPKKPKTNRDWLGNMSLIDLLYTANGGDNPGTLCIIDKLKGNTVPCDCLSEECYDCLSKYLNEVKK